MNKQQKLEKYVQQGNFKEAAKLLEPICRKQPHNIQCWLTLASYYGRNRQYKDVIRVCKMLGTNSGTPPQLQSLMGNAYACLGEFDQAYKHYKTALKSAPNDPELLNNLGSCLYLNNRYHEAIDAFEQVINTRPDYVDAHNNMGTIYKSLHENSLAVKHYQIALQLNPKQPKTLVCLGHLYADQFRHHEKAIDCFERALQLEPDNIEASTGLITRLRIIGRLEEALQKITELRSKKGAPDLLFGQEADIYERTGEYEKALDLIDMAASNGKLESDIMGLSVLLRICSRFDRCAEAIDAAEKVAANTNIDAQARLYLQFVMGEFYDRRKEYDNAFRCYKTANDLTDVCFDVEKHSQQFEELQTIYTRERLAQITKSRVDTPTPVFVIGMPRSGTSLTEQILSCHPEVASAGELNYVNDIASKLGNRIGSSSSYPSCITEIDETIVDTVANEYLDKLKALCGESKYITDKMPHNFMNVGLISILFPQAKIIHCTRDPVDTCLSIYFQNFTWGHPYASKLEWLGKYYRSYERLMQHWTSELDIAIHTVNYETMISNQEQTTRELLEFCGLPWNDACLNFHQSDRRVITASYGQVRQKLYTRSLARWKHYEKHIQPLIQELD